jgi:cell division protein ZapA (FtsZ GTPase activity inhibitor)
MESIQVEIFGQTYSIKVANDPEYIRELAAFVDGRMREVQKGTGTSDVYRIAILTALNITDELHRLRSQHTDLKKTATTSLDHLMEITDSVERK